MKVQCGQCPAKYAVADERIQDKKVRIRCRRCNAAIVVDGKVSPPLVTSTPARRSARPSSSEPPHRDSLSVEPPESLPPPSTPAPDGPRPVAHTLMGGLEAPLARQLVAEHLAESQASPAAFAGGTLSGTGSSLDEPAGKPDAERGFTEPPPAREDVERWRVALTQQDLRWMTTEEIMQAFRDGAVKSETFVFRAGMPTWVTLLEVSEIARALADAKLVSAPQQLQLDEQDSLPSSSPRRVSSLPPPRRAGRDRAGAADGHRGAAAGNDPEESLPFALVSGRANGVKKPSDSTPAEAPESPAPLREEMATPATAQATPLAPATTTSAANGAAPTEAAPAAPAPLPSPLEPTAAGATQAGGSNVWLWVLVALALAAAAAAATMFLAPNWGFRLH